MLDVYRDKYVGEKTEDGTTTYGTESNVYAGNHSYTATVGGIGATTELTTEQRSWKEDVIANIMGEEPLPGADYDVKNDGSWDIRRNESISVNFHHAKVRFKCGKVIVCDFRSCL